MSLIVSIPVASFRRRLAGVWLACVLLASSRFAGAQELTFLTLNGPQNRVGSVDGPTDTARFNTPVGLAIDGAGNLYVADQTNHLIRKITRDGFVSTLAGKAGKPGTNDGTGITARFNRPSAVAVDGDGNVYVADTGNHTVRQITAAGIVTTLAGTAGTNGSTDGDGFQARFNGPAGIAVDAWGSVSNPGGTVYVADTGNHTVRKMRVPPGSANRPAGTNWTVTTVAGWPGSAGYANGTNSAARLNSPMGLSCEHGNLYIADSGNHVIRVLKPDGWVILLAGSPGVAGGYDIPQQFNSPRALAASGTNVFVADSLNHCIRRITLITNSLTNVVVEHLAGHDTPGDTDGMGTEARFRLPSGISLDAVGNLFVADSGNHAIRKLLKSRLFLPDYTNASPGALVVFGDLNWPVTTFAGPWEVPGSLDGPGDTARFNHPTGVTLDAKGRVWIGDSENHTIRKFKHDGTVKTVAGAPLDPGYQDSATNRRVQFNYPAGLAADTNGTIFVADRNNHIIRRVTPGIVTNIDGVLVWLDAIVTNFAGVPTSSGANDGAALQARFNLPNDVTTDRMGRLYVADTGNHTIRRITAKGVFTLAGKAQRYGTNDGPDIEARFNLPKGVAVDAVNNIYVADWGNQTIRKITRVNLGGSNRWVVTTFAGQAEVPGWANGLGQAALFYNPSGVAVDVAGVVYVADSGNHVIRKITPGGQVSTVAGIPGSPGNQDGKGWEAKFHSPSGIEVDSAGRLYVTDSGNHTIRLIQPDGTVSTVAGPASVRGYEDDLQLNTPGGLATDFYGNLYIADWGTHTIRWISPGGDVGKVAGVFGVRGEVDGPGYKATFDHPFAVAVDRAINVYVADTVNHTIRRIARDGTVTTLAGRADNAGSIDGFGGGARFNFPVGIAVDSVTNIYVADYNNHTIRRITSAGLVSTFAGLSGKAGSSDGSGSTARFNHPRGVATDAGDNVYVADGDNHTIRKITPSGVVSTLAGLAGTPGTRDGLGSLARFGSPQAIAVDATGNLYVTDTNHTVRFITPDGNVKTVAGMPGQPGYADGTGPQVRLNRPGGLATTSDGRVYLSDSGNNVIRLGYPAIPDRPVIDLNRAPVAQTRQLSILDQSAVAWSWSFIRRPGGSSAQLSSTTAANPTFTPDVADVYVFRLSATNAAGLVALRDVTLRATPEVAPPGQMWISTGSSSDSATLTINVPPIRRMLPPRLQAQRAPLGQGILLTLMSDSGQPCELLAADSPGSTRWTTLTILTNVAGANSFQDTTTNVPARFYRLRELPQVK